MSNILLIEPSYRSKFPPLGLLRLSTYHKSINDSVTFARGKVIDLRQSDWHRIYISSLFTYELPRTIDTIKYYSKCVPDPATDIIVGGVGATLLPSYITDRVVCKVISGPLDQEGMVGKGSPRIDSFTPDYEILSSVNYEYLPKDAYFFRTTVGCIRNCGFCAVPTLEPKFGYARELSEQINEVNLKFGEKQNLILLDNNILAVENFKTIINQISEAGFTKGTRRNGKKRTVDFNQGLDARLITPEKAKILSTICLDPIRLAFDFEGMETQYRTAIQLLAEVGFRSFTNYVMFNFNDGPLSLYRRLRINLDLSQKHSILITSFPMRFVPIDDVSRRFVSNDWYWRYLRGLQCVLNATHGMVSPNTNFFNGAFGKDFDDFLEILSMPDRYIIHRKKYENDGANIYRKLLRAFRESEKKEFLNLLGILNKSNNREEIIRQHKKFQGLFEHHYPYGKIPRD
ncbi:MAG: cobalamin-binding domain-containing protein [Anaerolineaceae bacterium]